MIVGGVFKAYAACLLRRAGQNPHQKECDELVWFWKTPLTHWWSILCVFCSSSHWWLIIFPFTFSSPQPFNLRGGGGGDGGSRLTFRFCNFKYSKDILWIVETSLNRVICNTVSAELFRTNQFYNNSQSSLRIFPSLPWMCEQEHSCGGPKTNHAALHAAPLQRRDG